MRVAETPARDLLERLEPRNGRAHVVVRGSVVRVERRGGDCAEQTASPSEPSFASAKRSFPAQLVPVQTRTRHKRALESGQT